MYQAGRVMPGDSGLFTRKSVAWWTDVAGRLCHTSTTGYAGYAPSVSARSESN